MTKLILLPFTLAGLLASCGTSLPETPVPPVNVPVPVPGSSELISLTLDSGLGALSPPGLPSAGNASAVSFIKVNVKDADGNPMTFNGSNVYESGGSQTFITLSNTTPTAKLVLPKGNYSFENIGKASATGTLLAYGQDNVQGLSVPDPTVYLTLHTLIGAANSTLTPKLPTKLVRSNDKLDLQLAVKTPDATLNVPLSDYTVTYSGDNATVLTSDKLGANVQFGSLSNESSASVNATVKGWVATGAETASVQDQKVTFSVSSSGDSQVGVGTDTSPPTVTINPVAVSTQGTLTVSGTAEDDSSVARVRVFDGSMLIGSTDATDVTGGTQLISFNGTTWSFNWTSSSTAPELTAVAVDTAGNESRAALQTSTPVPETATTVVAWGRNYYGETSVPAGLTNVTAIVAGDSYNLALKTDGTVVAWGSNEYGQASVPAGLTNVTAIAAGAGKSLALKADGTVVTWGRNVYGQASVPAGLTNVTAIAAGSGISMALKTDGTVVAWGEPFSIYVPADLTNVTAIAAAGSYNLALKNDGTVVSWHNSYFSATPVPAGLTNVTAIAAGYGHSLALKSDGTVVAWGDTRDAELNVPDGLTNVIAISCGANYNLALKADGTVVTWGDNLFDLLNVPDGLTNVTAISAGSQHVLALRQDK